MKNTSELLKTAAAKLEEQNAKINSYEQKIKAMSEEIGSYQNKIASYERQKLAGEIVDTLSTKTVMSEEQKIKKVAELVNGTDDLLAMKKWAEDLSGNFSYGDLSKTADEMKEMSAEEKFMQKFVSKVNN